MKRIEIFLDKSWHDISGLLVLDTFSQTRIAMNQERKSAVSSCNFSLRFNKDLYHAIMNSDSEVPVKAYEDHDIIFDGLMEPDVSVSWITTDDTKEMSIDAVDFSARLDERIGQSATYPAVVDGPAFWIYNSDEKEMSILYRLLELCGFSKRIDRNAPSILQKIKHVAWTAGKTTYRQILDPLLSEYGFCLKVNADKITWVKTAETTLDYKDSITSKDLVSSLSLSRSYSLENGVEVRWPKTKVMEDTLLWRGSLPIGDTSNPRPGEPIAGGDYWPEDSDIVETWQDFGTEFLDTDYLAGNTRLKNEEVALISSSNQYVDDKKDESIVIDDVEDGRPVVYEALRARLRYRNNGTEVARLYYSDIKGKALVKTHKITSSYPEHCSLPQIYETSYVYDKDSAERLARIRYMHLRKGDLTISFSSRKLLNLGETYHMEQRPVFEGFIQIASISDKGDGLYSYTAYSTEALEDISVVSSGSQGSGENPPGQDGSSPRFIYKREYNKPAIPVGDNPAGWTFDVIPEGKKPVWMSMAKFSTTGNLVSDWTDPVRVSGADNGSYRGTSATAPSDPIDGDFFIYTGISNSNFIQYHIYKYVAIDDQWVETQDSDKVMACQRDALQLAKDTGNVIYAALLFVELLVANKLMIGGGDETSGLLVRFMDDDGSGKPIIEIRYNGEKLFWIDVETGKLFANFTKVVQYLPFTFNDSLDSAHPAVFSFYVPDGEIDYVKIRIKAQPFRTYAKNAITAGIVNTITGFFNGISYTATMRESVLGRNINTGEAGGHTHSYKYPTVSYTENGKANIQKNGTDSYSDSGHNHGIRLSDASGTTGTNQSHKHSVNIPTYEFIQTGDFSHEHKVDITHSHRLELGIEEDSIASGMTISIDEGQGFGPSSAISSGEERNISLSPAGWKDIKITSTSLGRVQVQVIVKMRIDTTQK